MGKLIINDRVKNIKCVVWDLDNTIWDGVLSEGDDVCVNENIIEIVKELDRRGVLNSIASKNDQNDTLKKLSELKILDLFVFPKISWSSKSASIFSLKDELNIGIETFLFVDDLDWELDEVRFSIPEISVMNVSHVGSLLALKQLQASLRSDGNISNRRLMYLQDSYRKKAKEKFQGTEDGFIKTLGMELDIYMAKEENLIRAEELTLRTNQLNSTGITFDFDDLQGYLTSSSKLIYMCSLKDNYGSHGEVGLCLIDCSEESWEVKLFLVSCRVITYGVGRLFMMYIMREAKNRGKVLSACFRDTGRNELMFVTLKLLNFKESNEAVNGLRILENDLNKIPDFPAHIAING